jgi:hypothetical protein
MVWTIQASAYDNVPDMSTVRKTRRPAKRGARVKHAPRRSRTQGHKERFEQLLDDAVLGVEKVKKK